MRQAKIVITVNLSDWMDVTSLINKLMDKLPWIVCTGGCSIESINEQEEPKHVHDDSRFQSLHGDGSIYETNVGYGAAD